MNLNFDKTDRLIGIIGHARRGLMIIECGVSSFFGRYRKPDFKMLCDKLADITNSDDGEATKGVKRESAFADHYQQKCNIEVDGKEMLEHIFNEAEIVKLIARCYWQVLPEFTYRTFIDSATTESKELMSEWLSDEPYKEIAEQVLIKQEPTIKDLEKEFWTNCSSVDHVDAFCNIYQARWNGCIKKVDHNRYNFHALLFDETNEIHQYFALLRKCGLLSTNARFVEGRLSHIAENINNRCDSVVEMFRKLRASTNPTESPAKTDQDDKLAIDYAGALKSFSAYISGLSVADFENVIRHRSLPEGAKRAKWIGSPVDAWRFQDALSWGIKTFNSVFDLKEGRPLRGNDKDKKGIDDQSGVCKVLQTLGLIQ